MLSNAYFLAKFRFDTAENEPAKIFQNLPIFQMCPAQDYIKSSAVETGASVSAPEAPATSIVTADGSQRTVAASSVRIASFWPDLRQNVARFRLYRHRFLQVNMRFAAFFKIYQILKLKFLKYDKIKIENFENWQNFANFAAFAKISRNFHKKSLIFQTDFLRKF